MVHITFITSLVLTFARIATPALAHRISFESHPRHQHLAERLDQRVESNHTLTKRWQFENKRATYYAAGLGACGETNKGSDFIVALNTPQMKELNSDWPSKQCFKMITISYGGKTAQAQITDECPVCPYGGLDLTEGLFSYFADTDLGVIAVDWSFNDGSGGGSSGGSSSGNSDDNKKDDDNEAWLSQSSKSAKSVLSTRSEASEASMATVRSIESVSEKSKASISSESVESKALVSSLSLASVRSTRSVASELSTESVVSVSSTSMAAYVATASIPIETRIAVNSIADEDANNLGMVQQLLLNFGNLAATGAS